jgi:hypothetical protein
MSATSSLDVPEVALLTWEQLQAEVAGGRIDTVVLAITDMQGRLQGKRFHAPFFLEEVATGGGEGCNYLLAVDVDMNTVDGYGMSSWSQGYGDFRMVADLATLRATPWQPGTALVLADLMWHDGQPVVASPRQILRRQIDRLAHLGLVAYAATELEFVVYQDSYEQAWQCGYRDLTPANLYNVDYSVLGTARIEPLLRRIRTEMAGAGLAPESAKGECNLGQHEIAFRYADALSCADGHAIYKNGAKEIAAQQGVALTFMAKPNAREGNSCHVHFRTVFGDTNCPVIAEVNNLSYDTRLTGPATVAIYGHNRVNIAFMPASRGTELIDGLRRVHPFERVYTDVLEAGLSIVNPAVHSGPCLLNVTAIENSAKRPFFLYEHGVTPASSRLNLEIDNERKTIGRKLGYELTAIEDFSGLSQGYTWQQLYMSIHGNIALTPISGPHDISSRYFTEDAPYGLVPWSNIGQAVGVPTPVIDSIVNIYSVLHERDWWREGRSADDLGLAGMSLEQIKEYVRTGQRPMALHDTQRDR